MSNKYVELTKALEKAKQAAQVFINTEDGGTRIAKRCNECLECHHFSNGCDGNSKPCEAFEYETR